MGDSRQGFQKKIKWVKGTKAEKYADEEHAKEEPYAGSKDAQVDEQGEPYAEIDVAQVVKWDDNVEDEYGKELEEEVPIEAIGD